MKVKKDVERTIPNKNYDGLAILDYEPWRPLYIRNWGSKVNPIIIYINNKLHFEITL